jgi:hypothetical protein
MKRAALSGGLFVWGHSLSTGVGRRAFTYSGTTCGVAATGTVSVAR